ncbi:hypothetical protein AAUPMC_12556 [Pasteurella multocida subsp. multocida str. Anand1_cattle]|nr:hypothetical protein AAUPMC_12556 [Pasteurella multocida subsp. multocida str. Anand1_cattle]
MMMIVLSTTLIWASRFSVIFIYLIDEQKIIVRYPNRKIKNAQVFMKDVLDKYTNERNSNREKKVR